MQVTESGAEAERNLGNPVPPRPVAQWRRLSSAPRVSLLVLALVALALAPSCAFLLEYRGCAVVLAVAWIGHRRRGRISDALALALPVFALNLLEDRTGPYCMAILVLLAYLPTGRPRFSVAVAGSLLAVLLAAIDLKTRFSGAGLTWHDVRFFFAQFRDNVGVLLTQPTVALCAGVLLALLSALVYGALQWDRRLVGGARHQGRWPVTVVVALSVMAFAGSGIAQSVQRVRAGGALRVGERVDAAVLPLSVFLASATLEPRWAVPPVPTGQFRAHAARLRGGGERGALRPDIVLILQESQFNPRSIAGCPRQLCDLDLFAPGPETVAFGPLRVHVFGSGTWLSEFAVNTGLPHTSFGEAGRYAPFNVAPGIHRSLARSLKDRGYRTVAVYATGGGMMNGRSAYAGYGFDAFYDAQDLGLSGSYRTTDHEIHAAAARVLARERESGRPVFLFVQTIYNHGEHGVSLQLVPPALLADARKAFSSAEAESAADYIWRTRQMEAAMAETRRAVLGGGRPAVLAWFGDHQPPFGRAPELRDRIHPAPLPGVSPAPPDRFQTWYHVSSNLARRQAGLAPGALDISFLPGLLAETAGLPLDDWLAANVSARQQCGGLLQECRSAGVRDAYLSHLRSDLKAFEFP